MPAPRDDRDPGQIGAMRHMFGMGAAALALGACDRGPGNEAGAARSEAKAPPVNAAADAARPGPVIDEQRLLDACVPADERQLTIQQLPRARRASLNRCYNEETVRQLTPRLPIRVDRMTEIVLVSAEGQNLVYRYRVAQPVADMPAGTPERLDAQTRRHACGGEDVRNIIALGGAQVFRWTDRDGATIREVRVDSCPEEGTTAR